MSANAFIIAWTVVALIGIRTVVVPREEAALVAKFGADYVQYRERTGALLPKLGQKGT
jgi:protein-S-isoprenylcysteine O-methyltransferase Ste14